MTRGSGSGRGRRTSLRNSPSVRSCGTIMNSSGTRSSPRLSSRREIGQYAEQRFMDSSLNESFSSSHHKEANVNSLIDPLNGSPTAKLAVNSSPSLKPSSMSKKWQLVELHSSSEETAEGSCSLHRVYADYVRACESVRQAAATCSPAPSTAASRAAQDCEKKESVAGKVVSNAQRCTLEESHLSRGRHPAAPSSSPTPIADNNTDGVNIGVEKHSLGKTYSSNLTEVISYFHDDSADEAEVDSVSPSLVTVYGYSIKAASASTLRGIIEKHGDIAAGCIFTLVKTRSCLLEIVCGIFETLQDKRLKDMSPESIKTQIDEVAELEKMKMQVGWLLKRLEEVYEARTMVAGCYVLKDRSDRLVQERDETREELERRAAEKLELEQRIKLVDQRIKLVGEKVNRAEVEIEETKKIARETKDKIMRYRKRGSMIDGLL